MYLKLKRAALFGSIIGLVLLIFGVIYTHQLTSYTAKLDTRPFNAGIGGKLESLDPALLSGHQEQLIASAIYEGLVYYDENSKSIKPAIAKSWKYSADGKSLTINLRNNVKFHNGKNLTANDVKASWERNFISGKEWSSISLFLSIVGSNERLEGKAQEISGIEIIDERTLKISFIEANSAFPYMLVNPIFWVVDCDDQVDFLPGTGPYMLKQKQDKSILLLRNEKYYRGLPRLSSINITIFEDPYQAFAEYKAGKLDFMDSVPLKELQNIKNDNQYKKLLIEKPLLETYSLGFNVNKEPFAGNYLLRRALNYAIDREAIIDNVLGGSYRSARAVIPAGVKGYKKGAFGYSYNLEKAKQLLEEAGFPMGEGLKPIILSYNNDDGHQLIAESIAQQLGKIGIEVQSQPMEWEYYKKQLSRMDVACFKLGWQADYPDADSFLYSMYHSSKQGISNFTAYHNPQVDKILDASRAETKSLQERIKLLNRAEEIIVDDAPCLWLFQKKSAVLLGDNVNSLTINNMGMIDWFSLELLKPSTEEDKDSPDARKV